MYHHRHEQTLAKSITISGCGLHTGKNCLVTIRPSQTQSGIIFKHIQSGTQIQANVQFTKKCQLATSLTKCGIIIHTIEHLLSALFGLNIDHAIIEVTGNELPILDGSALQWIQLIKDAGIKKMSHSTRILKIIEPIAIQDNNKWIRITPHTGLKISYTIDFNHLALGCQKYELLNCNTKSYVSLISSARTFCLKKDITTLNQMELIQGGNLNNAVVYDKLSTVNHSLRFINESIRHKILDLLGDFKLLNANINGYIEAFCTGHTMHIEMINKIINNTNTWIWD